MYKTRKLAGSHIFFIIEVGESSVITLHSNQASQRDAKTAARFCHPCWLRYV